MPALTYSQHWIAHPGFRSAIGEFLNRETTAMLDYAETLQRNKSPYKQQETSA